jgi:NAD(P)H-flavin reductase
MLLTPPQIYKTRVTEKYFVTENEKFLSTKFELTEQNNTLEFLAGQYISIKINEMGERRSYSIASTPDIDHAVSIVADISPGGVGSQFLRGLVLGQEVEMVAPLGKFVVDDSMFADLQVSTKLLFVATGSGIVPIYAMINDLLINKREERQMRLHWGMKSEEDLFWLDNLGMLAEDHANFVFDIVLSHPSEEWKLCKGHVQDCLKRDLGKGELNREWKAYICGNPKMITEVRESLVQLGMENEQVFQEKFT